MKKRFLSYEQLVEFLPDDERKIVNHLRNLILDWIPDCREKLTYNVPYYYRNRRMLFIWPASIPWGKVVPKGVCLGFCYGYLIPHNLEFLEQGSRQQVYTKTYTDSSQINDELIRLYLDYAVQIDDTFAAPPGNPSD